MKYLNLGCGNKYDKHWTNVDFNSDDINILNHDLTKPLPFENESFDVVYSSHVLEHFEKVDAVKFLQEQYRVLRKGGHIRIVVPDLEKLANDYLHALNDYIKNPSVQKLANYEWTVIHLLDQMVRTSSGGEMAEFWKKDTMINEDFIIEKVGYEYLNFRESLTRYKNKYDENKKYSMTFKIMRLFKYLSAKVKDIFKIKKVEQNSYLVFRNKGELHKWMYDRISLKQLLEKIGFVDFQVQNPFNSKIQDWEKYLHLDAENGQIRKPDSLFVEATKK
jgi:predicted SAM-dependent methyltransferase